MFYLKQNLESGLKFHRYTRNKCLKVSQDIYSSSMMFLFYQGNFLSRGVNMDICSYLFLVLSFHLMFQDVCDLLRWQKPLGEKFSSSKNLIQRAYHNKLQHNLFNTYLYSTYYVPWTPLNTIQILADLIFIITWEFWLNFNKPMWEKFHSLVHEIVTLQ